MTSKFIAETSVHSAPMLLAISTFRPSPRMKMSIPSWTPSRVMTRLFSSLFTSVYRTMGPAISWGNSTTKAPKSTMFRSAGTLPR